MGYISNGVWRIYTKSTAQSVRGERNARKAGGSGGYLIKPTSEDVTVKRASDAKIIRVVTKAMCPPGHSVEVKDGRTFVCRIERLSPEGVVSRSLNNIWSVKT